jgi:hypothetical protein
MDISQEACRAIQLSCFRERLRQSDGHREVTSGQGLATSSNINSPSFLLFFELIYYYYKFYITSFHFWSADILYFLVISDISEGWSEISNSKTSQTWFPVNSKRFLSTRTSLYFIINVFIPLFLGIIQVCSCSDDLTHLLSGDSI